MDLTKLFAFSAALAEDAGAGTTATTATTAEAGALSMVSAFLPMVLIVVVFYFLLIRPQRKKDKKVKDMLAALKVNDRITTIGGIQGTIVGIKDDNVTIAVGADKVKLVFARWAIRSVDEVSIENDSEQLV